MFSELLEGLERLIDNIFLYFGLNSSYYNGVQNPNYHILRDVIMIYILAVILYLIFRVIVCTGFQMNLTRFYFSNKEISSINDIKDTKSRLLNKVIKSYVKSAEKGISYIDINAITENQLLKLNFLGWNYKSIENFLNGLEYAFLIFGILFWLSFERELIFIVITIIAFVLIKIMSSIFDYSVTKEKLLNEIILYVEREVGQFYITDLAFSVQNFKMEMKEVFNIQTKTLSDSVLKISTDMANAIIVSNKQLNENIDKTINSLFSITDILEKPLIQWKESLEKAVKSQVSINTTFEKIYNAASSFENVTNELAEKLESYSLVYKKYEDKANNEIIQLTSVTEKLLISNKDNSEIIKSLRNQFDYIEENQKLLKESIQKYELTLEDVTKQMGSALGGIVEYQMQSTYKNISEYIKEDISKITNSSNELIIQLDKLFEKMVEQSRSETLAVVKIKEQIDMYFEKNENS